MTVILYFCTPENLQLTGVSLEIERIAIINDSNV
jgi:hypothetical protein